MNNHKLKNNNKWLILSAGIAVAALSATAPAARAATYTLDFDQSANGGSVLYNTDGTLQTNQWADWGLTNISGINNRHQNAAKFNLYNTDIDGGRDSDLETGSLLGSRNQGNLGTSAQGNVLIIQEEDGRSYRNGVYTADDEGKGGFVDFDFAEAVSFNSFSKLDIDDNGGGIMVEGQQADGNLFSINIDTLMSLHRTTNGFGDDIAQGTSVSLNGVTMTQVGNKQGDNSLFRFDVDQAHLTSVRFSYPGSGAIAGLEWGTVGEPPQEIPEPSAMVGLLMLGLAGKRLKCGSQSATA